MRSNLPVTTTEYELQEDATLVSRTDLKGRITYVSPAFVNVSEFTKEELMGSAHNVVRHPDMPEEAFADLWTTLGQGLPWTGLVKKPAQKRRLLLGARQCETHSSRWQDAGIHVGAQQTGAKSDSRG